MSFFAKRRYLFFVVGLFLLHCSRFVNASPHNQSWFPVNTKRLYHICTVLDQCLRRWSDVVQMLYKCFVFPGCVSWPVPFTQVWFNVRPALQTVGHHLTGIKCTRSDWPRSAASDWSISQSQPIWSLGFMSTVSSTSAFTYSCSLYTSVWN